MIKQMDVDNNKQIGGNNFKGKIFRALLGKLFRKDIDGLGLSHGTLWCVLEKTS